MQSIPYRSICMDAYGTVKNVSKSAFTEGTVFVITYCKRSKGGKFIDNYKKWLL